jgi:hypothetical protein
MFNIINLAAIFKLDITVRMSIIKILKINAGVISKKTLMLRFSPVLMAHGCLGFS